MGLLFGLDDTDAVRDDVADRGGNSPYKCAADKLHQRSLRDWHVLLEHIHGSEPRVVAHDIGDVVTFPACPKHEKAALVDLILQDCPALRAICLQDCLARVNGGDDNAPCSAGHGAQKG